MEKNISNEKNNHNLTLGIDDAGRGPVIGSMFLAGVLLTRDQEKILKKSGVSDSKQLYHSTRVRMEKTIKENSIKQKTVISSAKEIDQSLSTGTNLNTLEAIKTAEIINELNNTKQQIKVIIDCPSVNRTAWRNTLLKFIKHQGNLTIKCEHKADANHVSVSAASILAKVTRENEVTKLKKQFGDFGSGYPSDPRTKEFLKSHGKELANENLFRKTWSTWKKLFPDKMQKSLRDF